MKLIIAILGSEDANKATDALIEQDFRLTKLASIGGYLRRPNTTLLIGTEADLVERAIEIVREACAEPEEIGERRGVVFVLDVGRFERM